MGKVRIYELARKLNMQSKELLSVLQELDVEVSSHMSTITDETAELVIDVIEGEKSSGEAHETDESEEAQNPDITGETEVDSEKTVNGETASPEYSITPPITVNDLAEKISYSASKLIKELMSLGVMASVNDNLEADIIKLLADELDLNLKVEMK
ncbi:MAG: translation initiation factor IF-2 N-terminal domain-containing protein, partial [Halanaerobiales bacterium]